MVFFSQAISRDSLISSVKVSDDCVSKSATLVRSCEGEELVFSHSLSLVKIVTSFSPGSSTDRSKAVVLV